MMRNKVLLPLALLLAAMAYGRSAQAQHPTATETLALSAFGGITGTYTGLNSGRNLSLTAGADLAFPPYRGVRPSFEIRGSYPVSDGQVDSERSILGGLRADFYLGHRLHPYADFLIGRGQTNYVNGYIYDFFDYVLTTTYVYSPGLGIDLDLSDRLALKVDGQYQRWGSEPTSSRTVYSKAGTVGVVYRFDFNGHHRR